jgi:signal transduction histidine kinase
VKSPPAGARARRRFSTVRMRVGVELIVLTVAFSMLLGAGIMLIWARAVRGRLDDRAVEIARRVSSRLDRELRRGGTLPAGFPGDALAPPTLADGPAVVVVRGTDGSVLGSVPAAAPAPPFEGPSGGGPVVQTIAAGGLSTVLGDAPVRLLTVPLPGGCSVQVGLSESGLRESQARLRLIFLGVVPALTGAATLAAWGLAGRRLGRLTRIARQTAGISPSRLHERLETTGANDDLGQLAEEINRMLARLEAGFGVQDRFLSEVSHELKTPLSVLLLEAQIVSRSEPGELVYAKFVASVEEEMRRLAKLVESLLTLARAKHGDTLVRRVTVDMNEAAMEAGEHSWNFARMRDMRLQVSLCSDETGANQPIVAGDPDLLRTMIENLLRNAIAVSPRESMIDLAVACEDHHVTVRVRDRGPGVPDEVAPRIFDRFVTVDHTRQGIKGSGLGLAITRGIAELHGGEVRFRNVPRDGGGGAEFWARIPTLQPSSGHPERPR